MAMNLYMTMYSTWISNFFNDCFLIIPPSRSHLSFFGIFGIFNFNVFLFYHPTFSVCLLLFRLSLTFPSVSYFSVGLLLFRLSLTAKLLRNACSLFCSLYLHMLHGLQVFQTLPTLSLRLVAFSTLFSNFLIKFECMPHC